MCGESRCVDRCRGRCVESSGSIIIILNFNRDVRRKENLRIGHFFSGVI